MQATNMVLMLLKKNHNHLRIFHHGDWTLNVTKSVNMKNAPSPDIIETNLLTKIHDDSNKPEPFFLVQDIIGTNFRTKYHEDWTINVSPRVLTRQMLTPHNTHRATDKSDHKRSP
ncbi:hypothetical protein DPMN_133925 [Dreissena polymorpha]|uniref:Uncharacterized protein n=1 Tax=Dreissena polymorpha TaxID=45954 RepID=A0A9D4FZ70_DREPO|nr:hypothetical protein DPMN_133925 [Dreissena polymorpha]